MELSTTLTTFAFPAHGANNTATVRVIEIDGQPWFLASEVCAILGYSSGRQAVLDHVEPSQRNTVSISDGKRGNPNKTIINEGGLYALVLASQLPAAREFKQWVTDVVLPAIRKDGMYVAGEEKLDVTTDEGLMQMALLVQQGLTKKIERLQQENAQLAAENTQVRTIIGTNNHDLTRVERSLLTRCGVAGGR